MIIPELKNKYFKLGKRYDNLGQFVNRLFFIFTLFLFALSIYDIGFSQLLDTESLFNNSLFRFLFPATGFLYLIRSVFFTDHLMTWKVFLSNSILGFILIVLFFLRYIFGEALLFKPLFHNFTVFHFLAFSLFILEISRLKLDFIVRIFNPAQLFIFSFGFIILCGAFLLLMPQSTTSPINFTDAFFTSTSAVCVTGLTVVDTATRFTTLGKLIIITLIQIGGIGVVTITSFFGFFFKETSSFREQMLIRDYLSEDSFTGILKTLVKVILFTFSIELIGAVFIFLSLQKDGLGSLSADLRFSIFHSVSAFCNAGFSTLTDNLYDGRIRYNYGVHYSIANLIVLGGLGFPVFLNIYNYLKVNAIWIWEHIKNRKPYVYRVGMITFNTKIVVITTLILLLFGTIIIFFLESDATQKGMDFNGKIALSYFASVTPRTAGFNTVNMEALAKPTMVIMIFLMWVGASPVSTGGGIKTSTFTIAILNVIRIIRGKNHIEILHREIHEYSVNKAFSIIIMSLMFIGLGSFIIFLIDGTYGLLRIVFECFSAFATVGLSINLTPLLSAGSKWILILLMFFGRMGIMTLLLSLGQSTSGNMIYRYPKENLIIT
ncbi:MAG TPA: potassium transporter TrkG [Draconibacterium sp.]|nr:potassium transporter TrkG [Draconibacterium sp.]